MNRIGFALRFLEAGFAFFAPKKPKKPSGMSRIMLITSTFLNQ
jgi:hypothetical protein